jgi:hypothetical protein
MAITKHISYILTEAISEKKKEALFNLFLKTYDRYRAEYALFKSNKTELPLEYGNSISYPEIIFNNILELDPTPNNQYTQWLITKGLKDKYAMNVSTGAIRLNSSRISEDKEDIQELILTHFNKKQSKDFPSQYKDINKLNTFDDLRQSVQKYMASVDDPFDEILEKSNLVLGEDYEIPLQDNLVTVYIPKNEKSACVLGAKSSWCTTYGKHSINPSYKTRANYFDNYTGDGSNLYIIRTDEDDFFQIHFNSNQFMNEDDDDVGLEFIMDKMSKQMKEDFASLVIENGDVVIEAVRKYDDWYDLATEYLHSSDSNMAEYVKDDVFFDTGYYTDYDIEYNDRWGEKGYALIRETIKELDIEIEDEDTEEVIFFNSIIDNLSDSELISYIDEQDGLEDVKKALQIAIADLKRNADESIAFKTVMDTVAENMGYRNFEQLKEDVVWEGNKLVYKLYVENMSKYDLLMRSYRDSDEENDAFERVDEPHYGWDGDINWEDSYDSLSFGLEQI